MARQSKQTVDYFPHNCKHGKTIFILEKKYGNNGYAFWFKLLEELGSSEGHFLDLSDDVVVEFLSAKMMIPTTEMIEMFDLLSKLGNIDKELWSKRIVWCANFVSNIAQVYEKRVVSVPRKPIFDDGNKITDDGKQQSKVKYSKVNNISKDIGDKSPSKKEYGDPVINYIISSLKGFNNLKTLDGTQKDNRNKASMLINHKIKPELGDNPTNEQIMKAFDKFLSLISNFYKEKCTSVSYLYYNFNKLMNSKK